jgi:hypothetical protein
MFKGSDPEGKSLMSESAWKQMHDKVTTLDMLGVSNVYDMQGLHNNAHIFLFYSKKLSWKLSENNRNVMHRCHHEKNSPKCKKSTQKKNQYK